MFACRVVLCCVTGFLGDKEKSVKISNVKLNHPKNKIKKKKHTNKHQSIVIDKNNDFKKYVGCFLLGVVTGCGLLYSVYKNKTHSKVN